MKIKQIKFQVSERIHVPEIFLQIRLVYKNQASLKSLPYVFILPGGPGANHSHYQDYDCLCDVANLVFYDPRGCGLNSKVDSSCFTNQTYIDDIRAIKQALTLNCMFLLGKSYGAIGALGYTLTYPEDVSKLILAAGAPSYEFIETAKRNLKKRGTKEQQYVCESLWKGAVENDAQMEKYFSVMASMYSLRARNDHPVNRARPSQRFSFEVLNKGFKNNFWKFNYTKQLSTIACDSLILVGKEDWITDAKYSKMMAAQIPNALFYCFEHSDHSMESDVPEAYFTTIKTFIQR